MKTVNLLIIIILAVLFVVNALESIKWKGQYFELVERVCPFSENLLTHPNLTKTTSQGTPLLRLPAKCWEDDALFYPKALE